MAMAPKINGLFSCMFIVLLIFIVSHAKPPKGNRAEYMKDLEGLRKGDRNPGLVQLKAYLKRFGYLHEQDATGDQFDGRLEEAVRTYQFNHNLVQNGVLDAPTVNTMMQPRCSVPDIVNGNNTMHRGGSIHAVVRYYFGPVVKKWPVGKRDFTYGFVQIIHPDFPAPLGRAFKKWAAASKNYFTFKEIGDVNRADIKILVANGDHGDSAPFDGPYNVLAHAGPPPEGVIHFDESERWSDGPGWNVIQIEPNALHEIGHVMGLEHSKVPGAVMQAIYDGKDTPLQPDDIDGLRALYKIP